MRPLSKRVLGNLRHPFSVWHWWKYQKSRPMERDVLLITLPSAGTHWVRTMLARALIESFDLPEQITTIRQPEIIPPFLDKTARFKYNTDCAIPRIQHSHAAYSSLFGRRRVLLLVRDLRDALVSHYKIYSRAIDANISFSDFLQGHIKEKSTQHNIETRIEFLNSWWDHRQLFPDFKVVCFEEMKAKPRETLQQCLEFAGIPSLAAEKLEEVLDFCSIENMRKMEEAYPNPRFKGLLAKIGQGKTGGYNEYFSTADRDWFLRRVNEGLQHNFGYNYQEW